MSCLSDDRMALLLEGRLAREAIALAERHLDECAACRSLFVDLARSLPSHPRRGTSIPGGELDDEPPVSRPFDPGTQIQGRYVLLDLIGVGAMGRVYAAYDPKLDRRVALKVLRPESVAGSRGAAGRARLLKEARTLARLSHPGVVAVHDVGAFDQQVFVAMELVEGTTLRRWLAATPRPSWKRVLEVFRKAGRGLAAAHAAGITHRDFKPDNVLVGTDGRVRVTDFGLASSLEHPSTHGSGSLRDSAGAFETVPTRTGTLLGTPAYMAPEQHQGKRADERSDQFAFCVALYEALYGVRPFSASDLPKLMERVREGRVDPPPKGVRVPGAVRAAMLRGLSVDPARRFPSMDALCEALLDGPRRAKRFLALTLALIAGAAVTFGAIRLVQGFAPPPRAVEVGHEVPFFSSDDP